MRRIGWGIVGIFVLSWLFSLFCMHAAGQAGTVQIKPDDGNVTGSGDGFLQYDLEPEVTSEVAPIEEAGNAHSADQGDLEASVTPLSSRRIILERYGVRTYLSVEDYLPGVMVCQVGPELGMEALKCQAVIARTYLCRQMGDREEIQEEELDLDYLGDHTALEGEHLTLHQKEQLANRLEECKQAAKATSGVVMKYDDRYILPLFHECSAGRTRTGEADYPYLQSVESKWDTAGEKTEAVTYEKSYSLRDFAQCIEKLSDTPTLDPGTLPEQIQVVKRDDAGYVLQMKIGVRTYSGDDIQYALDLPSSCFTMDTKTSGKVSVLAKGRGHGYGLSQHGAEAMAEEGWNYDDILKYYYKNISLVTE